METGALQTYRSAEPNENNNNVVEIEAKGKHYKNYKNVEWVEKEETHVVAMCSQQIATGVLNRTGLDVNVHCNAKTGCGMLLHF